VKYTGSCHCQKVRFEVEMQIDKVISCNCSSCQRRGSLLAFTSPENFKLYSDAELLTEYRFGKKRIEYQFCSVCGVLPFALGSTPDGTKMRAINVRCLENVDISRFPVEQVDGASF
jgi:hypothetical protein